MLYDLDGNLEALVDRIERNGTMTLAEHIAYVTYLELVVERQRRESQKGVEVSNVIVTDQPVKDAFTLQQEENAALKRRPGRPRKNTVSNSDEQKG